MPFNEPFFPIRRGQGVEDYEEGLVPCLPPSQGGEDWLRCVKQYWSSERRNPDINPPNSPFGYSVRSRTLAAMVVSSLTRSIGLVA